MIRLIENDHGFKSVSMGQIEDALAASLALLVAGHLKVALKAAKDISDGADNLIGQERWELSFAVVLSPADIRRI